MLASRAALWAKRIVVAVAALAAFHVVAESAQAQHGVRIRSHLGRVFHHHHRMGPPSYSQSAMPSEGMPTEMMMGGGGYPAPGAGMGQAYYPGAAGPPTAQTAYPYYTTKGPNDFFYGGPGMNSRGW